ncbi:hypothetical protein ES702_03939 [subsurface metagenome]
MNGINFKNRAEAEQFGIELRKIFEELNHGPEESNMVEIHERASFGRDQIDKEAKIVRGVAILRRRSESRDYSERALEDTARLSEGIKVYSDHDLSEGTRSINDLIGFISNTRIQDNVVRGDFHYLNHSDLIEGSVERNPNLVGFSIHSYASDARYRDDGRLQVNDMVKMRSVDLVSDPGAVSGLFESKQGKGKQTEKRKENMDNFEEVMERAASGEPEPSEDWEKVMEGALGANDGSRPGDSDHLFSSQSENAVWAGGF